MPRRAAVLAALAVAFGGSGALAAWNDASSASLQVDSGSLVAATGVSATAGCTVLLPKVTLAWTPTASAQATGYRVFRKTGAGSYSQIATVAGIASNGYVDTAVGLLTSYTYYLEAYVGSWTAASATASATTAALCL